MKRRIPEAPVGGSRRRSRSEDSTSSRERERIRRRRQQQFLARHLGKAEQRMFWDGFQWISRSTPGTVSTTEHHATRKNRRLYVANIPFNQGISEDQLAQKLIQAMREKNPRSQEKNPPHESPVLHVWFSKDRSMNYGFVELATIEDTEIALSLDGLVVGGNVLTIRRPTDYALPLVPLDQQKTPANFFSAKKNPSQEYVSDTLLSIDALKPLLLHTAQPLPGLRSSAALTQQGEISRRSRVLLLESALFWASETTSDDEFMDAIDDISFGIRKFAGILPQGVFVARHEISDPTTSTSVLRLGDVVLDFPDISSASRVAEKLKNRKYDGQILAIRPLDEKCWTTWLRPILVEMAPVPSSSNYL